MSLKIKLISAISLFVLIVGILMVGVFALPTQTISMKGSVSFDIADKTLYVKDVRLKNDNTLSGQGTTLDVFEPGFINGEYKIDLGSISADTSFTLYFDIINTTSTFYSANETSTVTNASVSANGIIRGDAVDATTINEDTAISGTVELVVTISDPQNVNLNNITILLNEYEEPEIEHNDLLPFTFNESTLTAYSGSDSEVVIPETYSIRPSDGAFVEGTDYNVTAIGDFAFANCDSIISITIPESINSIGAGAFANCYSFENIYYNAISVSDLSVNNYTFYNAGANGNGITLYLGNGVVNIPAYLFNPVSSSSEFSPNIVSTNMPSNITSIGDFAFAYCNKLQNVALSTNLESIGRAAFNQCEMLSNVNLQDCLKLNSIGPFAFGDCSSFTEVTIPQNVASLGKSAFANTPILEKVNYNAIPSISLKAYDGVFEAAGVDGNGIVVDVGEGVVLLPVELFGGQFKGDQANVVEVNLSSTVQELGAYLFKYCSGLKEITLPESLTKIGDQAFNYTSISTIVIPKNVVFIGGSCFSSVGTVYFEDNTHDWRVVYTAGNRSYTVSAETLADPAQAAYYLTDKYDYYDWERIENTETN